MQIIQGLLIAAALIAIVLLLIVALGLLAFGIAADVMRRQDEWTDNGSRTENQRRWLEYLRQQGYYTAVCYGWQKAAELIERYLLHTEELTKEQKTITLR